MCAVSTATGLIAASLGLNLGNFSEYPTNSNSYFVALGSFLTSFSKVSGIVLKSSSLISINEGGNNKPFILKDVKKEFNTITFEKGYGTMDIMNLIDKINMMTIIIRGNDKSIKGIYYTDRAMVSSITLSDLNANSSEPLIQTMNVAYNTLKKSEKLMTALKFINTGSISSLVNTAISSQSRDKAKKEKNDIIENQKMVNSNAIDRHNIKGQSFAALQTENAKVISEHNNKADNQKQIQMEKQKQKEQEKLEWMSSIDFDE